MERRGETKVKLFAEAMINKLNEPKNLAKGGWENLNIRTLIASIEEETDELQDAYLAKVVCKKCWKETILKECADVANYAMMVADRVGALDD